MAPVKNNSNDYVTRVLTCVAEVPAAAWNALLAQQLSPGPFMRHEYLAAMEQSKSAVPATGWTPRFVTLWRGDDLHAACALYLKAHSYGEYVFDWAWANAYEQHQLAYYPKALVAVPFTPVPGTRLLARDTAARAALVRALLAWCGKEKLSSLHLLFGADEDVAACADAGLMLRHTVQFHWKNVAPTLGTAVPSLPPEGARPALGRPGGGTGWASFDDFLASLSQEKRKKIRQERRKVADAGISFRWSEGPDISAADWDFFYRCYERTYLEHGNAPYLTRSFFRSMAKDMPENWLLFVAERAGRPVATSLIAVHAGSARSAGRFPSEMTVEKVAYGRYWGALERVDCLHFEACYYQPLQWCIEHGYARFEGGAQGEHKMARALMPVRTTSAHWLAHPAFADAVERFLEREGQGIASYMEHLDERSPFRQGKP
ncbi:MAG: N-acetyltransferase [Burkholderiales bacterium]|nr:N-acetyltransferase [Burkholderiales bacterium]